MTAAMQAEKREKRRLRKEDGETALTRSDALSLNGGERGIEKLRNGKRAQTEPGVRTRK
jgi:hypothetical protein